MKFGTRLIFLFIFLLIAGNFCNTIVHAATYLTTADNEDNNGTGTPDEDMGDNSGNNCVYNDDPEHPIEFNINVTGQLPQKNAYLALLIEDVDFPDEIDDVYLNGHYLGYMIGQDDLDISTLFVIPDISWVKQGNNLVQIFVDRNGVGDWCANTRWGQLIIDEDEGSGPATIRYFNSDQNRYDFSDSVTINLEIDTSGTQDLRLELILRDPNGYPVLFDDRTQARSWTIQDSNDEPYTWTFSLPSSGTSGMWQVTLAIYDNNTHLLNRFSNVAFAVPSDFNPIPNIYSVTPSSGEPGQAISVNGTNFTNDTTCQIDSLNLTDLIVVNNNTITARIPTNIQPGTYDLTCTNEYGTGTLVDAFTVNTTSETQQTLLDVPTLNDWGMLGTSLLFVLVGLFNLYKKSTVKRKF